MQSPVYYSYGRVVRPSVCLSVCLPVCHTLALSQNNASYRITKSLPTDSPRILVLVDKKFIQKFERVQPE